MAGAGSPGAVEQRTGRILRTLTGQKWEPTRSDAPPGAATRNVAPAVPRPSWTSSSSNWSRMGAHASASSHPRSVKQTRVARLFLGSGRRSTEPCAARKASGARRDRGQQVTASAYQSSMARGGSRIALGSRPVTTARPRDGHLSRRPVARRLRAAVRVSGRPGDDAPDLAIGLRLTPGCAQAGTPARAAASVRSPKPRMSVMRPPLTVRTCQRRAVPPASRAAGVPETSSPTRSVPGPAVTSVTTARARAARALAHQAVTWPRSRQSASPGPSGAPSGHRGRADP